MSRGAAMSASLLDDATGREAAAVGGESVEWG